MCLEDQGLARVCRERSPPDPARAGVERWLRLLLLAGAVTALLAGRPVLGAEALPERWTVEFELATSLEAIGRAGEARAILQRLYRAGHRGPALTLALVRTALATGHAAEAREAVKALESGSNFDEPERSILLADAYLELGDRAGLPSLLDALSLFPESQRAVAARVKGLLALGRTLEAVAAARSGVESRPGEPEPLSLLAETLLETKRAGEAADLLTPLAARVPAGPERLRLLAILGRACLEAGRLAPAGRWAAELLRAGPESPEALRLAASIDTAAGQHEKALERLDRLVSLRPDDKSAHLARVEALHGARAPERYEREVRKLLERWPQETQLRRDLGWSLLERGQADEALRLAAAPASRSGAAPADLELLAESLRASNRKEEAVAVLRKLLEQNPSPPLRRSLAYTLLALGRAAEALQLARGLAAEDGRTPDLPIARTVASHEASGGHPDSLQSTAYSLSAGEARAGDLKLLAECHLALGDRREAIRLLVRARTRDPDTLRLLARARFDDGQAGEALRTLEPLRAQGAAVPDDLQLQVQCLVALGRGAEAFALLTELEQRAPDLATPEVRVRVYLATGRKHEARELLGQLATRQGTAGQRCSLGWLLLDAGSLPEALEVARGLDCATATVPELEMAIETYVRGHRTSEAVAALRRLRALAPSATTDLRLIEVLSAAGDKAGALPLARSLAAREQTPAALRAYADLALALGLHREALAPLHQLARDKPAPDTLELLATTQSKLGFHDQALATVAQWERLRPGAPAPALQRFWLLSEAGRREEAAAAARAALALKLEPAQREQLELDLFYLLAALERRPEAISRGEAILERSTTLWVGHEEEALREVRRSLAFLLKDAGREAEAVEMYRSLVDHASTRAESALEFVELLLAAKQRAEALEHLERLVTREQAAGPAPRSLLAQLASRRESWREALELARAMAGAARGESEVLRSLVSAWLAMGRSGEARDLLRPLWKLIGPREAWLERATSDCMLSEGRWKEALDNLARLPWTPGEDTEKKLALAEGGLGAPREVQGASHDLLASVAPSALSTHPETARRATELRKAVGATRLEAGFHSRTASDGLEEATPTLQAQARLDARQLVAVGIEGVGISRAGLARDGALASVEYTRQLTADLALTGRLEVPVGLGGAAPAAARVEFLSTRGTHGDPVRLSVGQEMVKESPAAWARGLQSTAVKVGHERPRAGGALSTAYEARAEALDGGIERWSAGANARLRVHRRLDCGVGASLRDASGEPEPRDLYFAPKDYAAVQADASWRAAELGRWGDWTLRAGLHADRVQGTLARGTDAGLRAEFPLGPEDSLELDWNRFDNSANRISGVGEAYLEESYRLQYRTRY